MTSNTVCNLVDAIVENLGEQADPMYRDSKFEQTLRNLALAVKQEMEQEEEAFCRHLEEMFDGMAVMRDAALERGVWA